MVGFIIAIMLVGLLYVDHAEQAFQSSLNKLSCFPMISVGDLSQWSVISGDWYIDQRELVGRGIEINNAWIYAGDTSWTNYTLRAKVIFIDSNPENSITKYR